MGEQEKRRQYLIRALLRERPEYEGMEIPAQEDEQKQLLRGLMNIRAPKRCSEEFLNIQDAYLQEAVKEKGIVELSTLESVRKGIYLWQGDITTLRCDAIVNAANSGMTGCYVSNHKCIDNCIHSFAGVQLRLDCARMMEEQGHEEPTGQAKITKAYNLPCRYVLHTVGPIVQGKLTEKHCALLRSCYLSCLELAAAYGLESLAFCCISTGVFCFPNDRAAQIAVQTVQEYLETTPDSSVKKVIFNVFKEEDRRIYENILRS